MATLSVRIDDNLRDAIAKSADFEGITTADYIRETLAERVQDEQDYKDAIAVLNENNETVPADEVIKQVFG